MALAKVLSCAVVGLDGELVEVEVDVGRGKVTFQVVGLGDTAVQEARERVRSAIKNSGFDFPIKRLIVSLAPADLRKEGPAFVDRWRSATPYLVSDKLVETWEM